MSTLPKPSAAALRAVQQYRRRDVVPYLALRYYLANTSARRDRWTDEVAVQLVLERATHPYFAVKHFKGHDQDIRYRDMFLPGANEALAESVLLGECAKHAAFQNPPNVFSYHLARPEETDGVFQHYLTGLRHRHQWLAHACRRHDRAVVRYADVREFYPSIPPSMAKRAWSAACEQSALPARFIELGRRLLDAHLSFGKGKLLTGPMFSHVLGNLVLRALDNEMAAYEGVSYCRYVDDIVLVGPKAVVNDAYKRVEGRLADVELKLHPPDSGKHLEVGADKWLRGEHDFEEGREIVSWKTFVGGLKWLLTSAPDRRSDIQKVARQEGFRIPIPDYSGATREASYLRRLKALVGLHWFSAKRRGLEDVMAEGRVLRARYLVEIEQLLTHLHKAHGYERKRTIPKLRYRAGRLAYLASVEQLGAIGEQLRDVEELQFHAVTLLSIATGDVTQAIRYGANVAQAVAQPLHSEGRPATVQGPINTEIEAQGLAVLALNGVETTGAGNSPSTRDEFLRLAQTGADPEHLRSADPYVREFASLHGVGQGPRHAAMLESAFDAAEDSVFDALSQAMYLPSE